jgi:transposase
LDAIFWILRTGAPWRDVPEEFGPWKTVYNHFDWWNADRPLDQVRKRLLSRFVYQDQIEKNAGASTVRSYALPDVPQAVEKK